MSAFAVPTPALPGSRARNLLICLALLLICVREASPLVRAFAQEGGDGTVAEAGSRAALGTAFTFQGRVEDSGLPLDGLIDLQFRLYSDAAGTVPVSGTTTIGNATVSNGVFSEWLDFGNAFPGEQRWISVSARPGDSDGAYTPLGLQELTATPYAIYSAHTAFGQTLSGTNSTHGLLIGQGGSGEALDVINSGTGDGISTEVSGIFALALDAKNGAGTAIPGTGSGLGIAGHGDTGVAGYSSTAGYGATYGVNNNGYGVVGDSSSATYAGVLGRNPGGAGVKGTGANGVVGEGQNGVLGTSTTRGTGGTYGISYAGADCSVASNATKCYGAIGFSAAPNGSGVGVYGNGTWAGLYGVAGIGSAWAAVMEGKTYFGGTLDGPGGQLTGVHLQPDLDNFRYLGWGNRAWLNVVSYDFDTPSDARLKTNVNDIARGLDAVMAMRPVSYELIASPGPVHLGLIAQEVQAIVPEVVDGTTEGDDRLSMNYSELIPVLIKAIQELQAEVEALKSGQ